MARITPAGGGSGALGTPPDGSLSDGLLGLTSLTQINDAIDQINESIYILGGGTGATGMVKYFAAQKALAVGLKAASPSDGSGVVVGMFSNITGVDGNYNSLSGFQILEFGDIGLCGSSASLANINTVDSLTNDHTFMLGGGATFKRGFAFQMYNCGRFTSEIYDLQASANEQGLLHISTGVNQTGSASYALFRGMVHEGTVGSGFHRLIDVGINAGTSNYMVGANVNNGTDAAGYTPQFIVETGGNVFHSSVAHVKWATTTDAGGSYDLGLVRDSAGVLRVSNGSTGYGGFVVASASSRANGGASATEQWGLGASAGAASCTAVGDSSIAGVSAAGANSTVVGAGASSANTPKAVVIGAGASSSVGGATGGTVVIGYSANSSSDQTVVIGSQASSSSVRTVVVGRAASAGGSDSTVVGNAAGVSTKTQAIAIGSAAQVGGHDSIAMGYSSSTTGDRTTAVGKSTVAGAADATVFGANANTTGSGSIAIGSSATTGAQTNAIAIGFSTNVQATGGIAIGTSAVQSGANAISIGTNASANGTSAVGVGTGVTSSGNDGVSLGASAFVNGTGSIAIGKSATTSTFTNSLAIGVSATVTANNQAQLGTSAQPFNIQQWGSVSLASVGGGLFHYNTVDQVTNYERAQFFWTSGVYVIQAQKGGSGVSRSIEMVSSDGSGIKCSDFGGIDLLGSSSGFVSVFAGDGAGISLTGRLAANNQANVRSVNGTFGTPYSSPDGLQQMWQIVGTINQSGSASWTGLEIAATVSSSGSGDQSIIDGKVGSVRQFRVDAAGAVTMRRTEVTKTGNYTVLSTETNTNFNNSGAGGQVIFTLPTSAPVGTRYSFTVLAAQNIQIKLPTSETLRAAGIVTTAAGTMTSNVDGNTLTIEKITSTKWYTVATVGTAWTAA